jgi:predicted RNA methylase
MSDLDRAVRAIEQNPPYTVRMGMRESDQAVTATILHRGHAVDTIAGWGYYEVQDRARQIARRQNYAETGVAA